MKGVLYIVFTIFVWYDISDFFLCGTLYTMESTIWYNIIIPYGGGA
jgi:hypothetical protein